MQTIEVVSALGIDRDLDRKCDIRLLWFLEERVGIWEFEC